jgi:hypothetical protein
VHPNLRPVWPPRQAKLNILSYPANILYFWNNICQTYKWKLTFFDIVIMFNIKENLTDKL